ncbi:MAG: hypothetical protein ACLQU3_04940 [Limisphaerales bacterium]
MKETRSLINSLLACGIAFAMVSTLAAQTVNQGSARVVRMKGDARYKTGSNDWQPLKVGDVLRPGTLIQTAAKAHVDFVLGTGFAGSAAVVPTVASLGLAYQPPSIGSAYQPSAEQNIVRMWENTLLSIDKLTISQTGADEVTETQLDLKAGHIFGIVKKMSAASKYEIKIPNGVAGIRGSVYDILADGVVAMQSGSAVLAYSGPNGTVLTQVIMGKQRFDARTGALTPLGDTENTEMENLVSALSVPPSPGVTTFYPTDKAFVNLISPH